MTRDDELTAEELDRLEHLNGAGYFGQQAEKATKAWPAEMQILISRLLAAARARSGEPAARPEPNPEWEAKAAAFRASLRDAPDYEGPEPEATLTMLRTWMADAEPANEHGQVSFSRAMLESAEDALAHLLAAQPPEPRSPAREEGGALREALAREIHHQAHGPSAWGRPTDLGRTYWVNRLQDAERNARPMTNPTPSPSDPEPTDPRDAELTAAICARHVPLDRRTGWSDDYVRQWPEDYTNADQRRARACAADILAAQSTAGTGETEPAEPTGDCVTVLGVAGPGLQQRSGAPLSAVRAPTTTRTGEAANVGAGEERVDRELVLRAQEAVMAVQLAFDGRTIVQALLDAGASHPGVTCADAARAVLALATAAPTPALTGAGEVLTSAEQRWVAQFRIIYERDPTIAETGAFGSGYRAAARAAEAASGKTEGGE